MLCAKIQENPHKICLGSLDLIFNGLHGFIELLFTLGGNEPSQLLRMTTIKLLNFFM
jgi:hypothetical protein